MNNQIETNQYCVILEYVGPFLSSSTGISGQSISFEVNQQESDTKRINELTKNNV